MEKAKEKQKKKNERGGEEKMQNGIKSKRQKGITLIALVITIVRNCVCHEKVDYNV